jgi:hypothetical protein
MKKQKNTTPQEPYVTVGDVDYSVNDMTDEQKMVYAHIENVKRKVTNAKFNLEELEVCQNSYVQALVNSLSVSDEKN